MFKMKRIATAAAVCLATVGLVEAQSGPVTIQQAIEQALENYPAIRASLSDVSAAESGIGLAKANYLPHADLYYQVNRATRNNIFGLLFPNPVIAPTVYARGTGALLDGSFQGGANGLAPNIGNWAVGFGVSFPVFDYKQNQVRREIELHRETAEKARLDEILDRLKSQEAQARVDLEKARQIAENTPTQLSAAQTLEKQAQARYQAGLGTVVEVADSQRLLRQAETDNALAKLGLWRALFALEAAKGDITDILAKGSR